MVTLDGFCYHPRHATQPSAILNLQLSEPGMVAILGGNGSGKSTLAQLLAGWYPDFLPGDIRGVGILPGKPIGQASLVEHSQTVQLVQQTPMLQLSGCTFSVEEEVAFGPENLCLSEAEILQRVDAALTFADCQTLRHRHPATLSGGESQRVVIASAMAMQPRLLLLDEAFSRLTPQATQRLLQKLAIWAEEQRALVVLFERHRLPALDHCQHAWQLSSGELTPLC